MNHLERSEQLVAFAHEERDSLQNKVLQLEGEIQKLERKNQRNYGAGRGGGGRKDAEIEQLTKQIEKSLKDIEDLRSENAELLDRLTVARQERSEALIEKDKILQKQYLEEQNRKKAENEVKNLLKRLQSLKETTESQSSEESNSLHTTSHEVNNYVVKMEDFTTVIQASEGCIIMVIMKIKLYNDN
jgi:predicted  nucleic acid-binding Zn-ribbon protein